MSAQATGDSRRLLTSRLNVCDGNNVTDCMIGPVLWSKQRLTHRSRQWLRSKELSVESVWKFIHAVDSLRLQSLDPMGVHYSRVFPTSFKAR